MSAGAEPRLPDWMIPAAVAALFLYLGLLFLAERHSMNVISLPGAGTVVAVLGLSLCNYALRLWRWQLMLEALGHRPPFLGNALIYVAGFAFTVTPAKAGEGVRAIFLRGLGVPVPASLAALFVERLLDLMAVALLALLLVARLPGYRLLMLGGLGLTAVAFLFLVSPALPRLLRRLAASRTGRLQKLMESIAVMLEGARVLLTPWRLASGLALGVVAWAAEGYGLSLLLNASSGALAPDWIFAIGAYSLGLIAGVVSFLPGGVGGAEAALAALLTTSGMSLASAIAATALCRLSTLWFAVVLGLVAISVLHRQGRRSLAP